MTDIHPELVTSKGVLCMNHMYDDTLLVVKMH